jgi:predicted nucleic acid-binding protein
MAYLLDTCAISELWKPLPNEGLLAFFNTAVEEDLFLSVLSLGEIKKGVERLPPGNKRTRLRRDYLHFRARFSARVLPVTDLVAEHWGALDAEAARRGLHLKVIDGLLAATAILASLTVVTRNSADFDLTPAPWVNPWT